MATGGALIGALRVTLGLDSAQFEAGSKRARQTAKADVSAIQREFDRLKTIGGSLAGIWASSEIIAAGKRALDYASSLGEVAQQLGVTTKDLQTYRFAASQAGVSQEQMDSGLARLTRTIGEAKAGSKAQATVFRELGVAVQDANGRVFMAGELMPKLADAISKIKDPATRARVEIDLFGKAGQKLDTLLASGSKGINELRDAAQRLGVVLSDDQIQKADETADKLAAVKMVLESRIAGVVSDNADAILKIGDALGYAAGQVGQFFKNMQGVERLKRDEGWASGFFSGWDEQATAADPVKYLQMRTGNLTRATAERKKAEAANTGKDYFGFGSKAVRDARAKENEALRLVQAAKNDPGLKATIERERARNAATATPIPDGALPTVASTGGGRKKGHSGPTAAEIEAKHQQELSRLRQDALQAELQLTTDAEKRAELQSQLLLEEFNERSAQIANDEHFTIAQKAAQQAALKAPYGVSGEGNNIVVGGSKNSLSAIISRELSERLATQALEVRMADLEAQRDNLQGQLGLARTADDRRKIELEILDLEYQLRAAKLEHVINSQESSKAEKDLAQMAKDRLAGQRAVDVASVERQNMGPMATYLDSLPKTAGEVNEAFEQIAANGLANMNDQLANAAANTLKLKGLAGQLFNQLIADVIRLNLQQATGGGGSLLGGLLKIGGSIFGGSSGLGGVSSSSMDSINAQVAGLSSKPLPGLVTGGTIGGLPGIDNNVLSINGIPTARVSANERIRVEPNSANDNGGRAQTIRVVPSPYFDVVVDQRAAGVAAPMSVASGLQARSAAGSDATRAARRRIPGR